MTRYRLDRDPEGTHPHKPHPQEEAMSTHHLQLFAEDGEIRPRLTCTATPDSVCRRRPVDTDQESWTDEDETTPGHECWAVEWAEAAGWDTVTAADGILSSVDVEVTYDEGVVVDLAPPQPTLPDLAEPSDAEVRAAAEESEHHEQWGYDEDGFPHCECGASLVESEHDLGVVPSLMAHQARAALTAARKAARHENECEKSTTDLVSIRDWYAGAVDEYWCDTGMLRDEAEADFDRAIAAHDRALREQIAQKIEVEMRRHDNAQIGFSAVGDAYAHAARIAREEGSD